MILRGFGPVLLRNLFSIFQGGSGPPVPPLDPHMSLSKLIYVVSYLFAFCEVILLTLLRLMGVSIKFDTAKSE